MALKTIWTNRSMAKGAPCANWTPIKTSPVPKSFGLPLPVRTLIAARGALHYSRACCTAAQPSHVLLLRLLANCAPALSALVSPCSFLAAINFCSTTFLHGRSEACVCPMRLPSMYMYAMELRHSGYIIGTKLLTLYGAVSELRT